MKACLFYFSKACICFGVRLYLEESCFLPDDMYCNDAVADDDVMLVVPLAILDDMLLASLLMEAYNGNKTEP
jgi:hypothetical protein